MNEQRRKRLAPVCIGLSIGLTIGGVEIAAGALTGANAYGSVPLPGTKVVHLPAGEVQVAYKALIVHSSRESVGLSIPAISIDIQPANGDGPAPVVKQDPGDVVDADDDVHARVFTAEVPREADYRVTAKGEPLDAEEPAIWLGHGSPWLPFALGGGALTLVVAGVFFVLGRRARRAPPSALGLTVLLALLLAGCGGDDGASAPAPLPSPTPPATEQLKYDLLTAAIQLEAYKLAEQTYTADETRLGPAFPATVTVKEADATSFSMAAYDDRRIRYALIHREGEPDERTCKPAVPDACPDGEW